MLLPTLEAERVVLRWLTREDIPALYTVFSDPEVMRFWGTPPMEDETEAHALLEEIHTYAQNGALLQWGLARRSDDQMMGTCTLVGLDIKNRRAEIGFALGRAHWGKGYMREMLPVLLDHVFETLDLHGIEADVDPRNTASIRLLEHLGFKREGVLRERWFVNGEAQDSIIYGLLRREWQAR